MASVRSAIHHSLQTSKAPTEPQACLRPFPSHFTGQQVSLLAWVVSKPYTKAVTGGGKGLLVLPLEDAAGDTALLLCDASVPCYARCALI